MPCYESGKSIMTAACCESGNDDDESDNNEDKICLLLKSWGLVGHILDQILNHMIISFVTKALQFLSFKVDSLPFM